MCRPSAPVEETSRPITLSTAPSSPRNYPNSSVFCARPFRAQAMTPLNCSFPSPGFNAETSVFLSMDAVRARPLPPTPENVAWAKAVFGHLIGYGEVAPLWQSAGRVSFVCQVHDSLLPGSDGLGRGRVWTFEADEAGTGKDTLADLTHVQQTGAEMGISPTTDVEGNAQGHHFLPVAGGSFFHLGNVRGVFRCSPL